MPPKLDPLPSLIPPELDAATYVDDPTFMAAIDKQRNLPDYVKEGLRKFTARRARRNYAAAFPTSSAIAAPISAVLTVFSPFAAMSAVRSPRASTAEIAASTMSASLPMPKE